jgi:type VI secretion system protein ImpK
LATLLRDEISRNSITVDEQPDRSIVRLNSDRLFASGSAELASTYRETLQRVAEGLKQSSGRIEVIGHSDNVPLKSLRFASNRELSRMRAQHTLEALASMGIENSRLVPDGLGESQPIAPNETEQGRAKNRRVELVVYDGAPPPPPAIPASGC